MARFRRDTSPAGPLEHGAIPLEAWHSEDQVTSAIGSRRQIPVGQPNYQAWALFLNAVHVRMHPRFADEYLASLEKLPPESPFQDLKLRIQIELHIVQSTGEIETIGVRLPSGLAEFDIAAMTALSDAIPPQIPPGLASPDGRVYLLWEMRRDAMACSTLFAHPYRFQ